MSKQRDITLQMLAQRLNMHPSTVSRVLNATPETAAKAASPETIARIQALAAQWDYRPNPYAISLRKNRSNLIGVVIPRITDLVLAFIYEGIDQAARRHAYFTFVTNSYDDPEIQSRLINEITRRRVDGFIIGDARVDAAERPPLGTMHIPVVLVNRRAGNLPSVTVDDYHGGRLAALHLLEQGHRRVGIIAGLAFVSTGQERTAGFVDAFRDAGVAIDPRCIVHAPFDTAAGHATATRILSLSPRPTALFAVNDFGAIGAMGAVREAGLVIGKDIAVVGFNDIPLAAELPVPLTTIRSPLWDIGYKGMELLLGLLRGEEVDSVRLAPELVVRASSLRG